MARLRPVEHEDRLTLVEHLEELRSRLIVSLVTFGVAFAICFWQNNRLLDIANKPLPADLDTPITFGVSEPFTTTITVCAYAALMISLPVLLYQLYAFIVPAMKPGERQIVVPLLLMIPFLFIAGVVFGYFLVLPAATKFLLNFNDTEFNIQVQARQWYSFFALTLISCGVIFQLPVGILAVTRMGVITPQWLAQHRRHAVIVIAVVAMALPGTDPVSMLIEMVPLLILFEISLILARAFGTPKSKAAAESSSEGDAAPGQAPG